MLFIYGGLLAARDTSTFAPSSSIIFPPQPDIAEAWCLSILLLHLQIILD